MPMLISLDKAIKFFSTAQMDISSNKPFLLTMVIVKSNGPTLICTSEYNNPTMDPTKCTRFVFYEM